MPAACAAQNADDLEPVQEWTLPERAGNDSNLQYPTNFARFQNVQTLVMYFPTNHGADVRCRNPLRGPPSSPQRFFRLTYVAALAQETKLLFVGFRGKCRPTYRLGEPLTQMWR